MAYDSEDEDDYLEDTFGDPLPAEPSQMESVFSSGNATGESTAAGTGAAVTESVVSMAAGADTEATAVATADSGTIVDADAEGNPSAHALAAARAHLAAVAEELTTLQDQFGSGASATIENDAAVLSPSSQVDGEKRPNSRGSPPQEGFRSLEKSALTQDQERILRLERVVRHLQVDFDCAKSRAERLAYEKEELLAAHSRMEAELRVARHGLEEARRHLRHCEMDVQRLTGKKPVYTTAEVEQQPSKSDASSQPATASLVSPVLHSVAESARPTMSLSKPQAIAALKAAQGELRDERKRRERLERRIQKDKERLERLMSVAERQRDEIRSLQMYALKRCGMSEVDSVKVNTVEVEASSDVSGIASPVAISARSSGSPFGARTGQSGAAMLSLTRNQSAPTRLPTVGPPKRG